MPMGQNQIRATKGALGEGFATSKHRVCRGLSWKREDDRLGQSGIDQAPGVGQCRFGLAAACGGFDDRQCWGKRQVVDHDLSAARMLIGFEQSRDPLIGQWRGDQSEAPQDVGARDLLQA